MKRLAAPLVVLALVLTVALPARASDKPIRFTLSAAAIALDAADIALTIHGVTHHNMAERSVIWRPFVEKRQWGAVWGLSALADFVVVGGSNLLISNHSKPTKVLGYAILITAIALRTYVVIHNARLNAGKGGIQ